MHGVRVPKLLRRHILVVATTHFGLGFSQTSPVFRQSKRFRRNCALLGYNPLTGREIASRSRDFPDEEGTERKKFRRTKPGKPRSRDFPDVEGTESPFFPSSLLPARAVPETSPMKRGLKGCIQACHSHSVGAFQRLPR